MVRVVLVLTTTVDGVVDDGGLIWSLTSILREIGVVGVVGVGMLIVNSGTHSRGGVGEVAVGYCGKRS